MKLKYLILQLVIIIFFCGCASTKSPTSLVSLDISESYSIVKDTRPSAVIKFPEQDGSYTSIVKTMSAYKNFGDDWYDYANRLEEYIEEVVMPQLTLEGSEI